MYDFIIEKDRIFLIIEYMTSDLYKFIELEQLNETNVKLILKQILEGVK